MTLGRDHPKFKAQVFKKGHPKISGSGIKKGTSSKKLIEPLIREILALNPEYVITKDKNLKPEQKEVLEQCKKVCAALAKKTQKEKYMTTGMLIAFQEVISAVRGKPIARDRIFKILGEYNDSTHVTCNFFPQDIDFMNLSDDELRTIAQDEETEQSLEDEIEDEKETPTYKSGCCTRVAEEE